MRGGASGAAASALPTFQQFVAGTDTSQNVSGRLQRGRNKIAVLKESDVFGTEDTCTVPNEVGRQKQSMSFGTSQEDPEIVNNLSNGTSSHMHTSDYRASSSRAPVTLPSFFNYNNAPSTASTNGQSPGHREVTSRLSQSHHISTASRDEAIFGWTQRSSHPSPRSGFHSPTNTDLIRVHTIPAYPGAHIANVPMSPGQPISLVSHHGMEQYHAPYALVPSIHGHVYAAYPIRADWHGFHPNSGLKTGRWTEDEKDLFMEGFKKHGYDYKAIAPMIKTRTVTQVRTHAQKVFAKLQGKPTVGSSTKSFSEFSSGNADDAVSVSSVKSDNESETQALGKRKDVMQVRNLLISESDDFDTWRAKRNRLDAESGYSTSAVISQSS